MLNIQARSQADNQLFFFRYFLNVDMATWVRKIKNAISQRVQVVDATVSSDESIQLEACGVSAILAHFLTWIYLRVLNQIQITGFSLYISIHVFQDLTLSFAVGSSACAEDQVSALADSTQLKSLSCILGENETQIAKTSIQTRSILREISSHNTKAQANKASIADLE